MSGIIITIYEVSIFLIACNSKIPRTDTECMIHDPELRMSERIARIISIYDGNS